MKILVLGSEGFIGKHTFRHFKNGGHQVTGADIILKDEPGYKLINPELPDFSGIFANKAFDVCINATGAANVQFSFAQPGMDYILNVSNVYAILDAIRKYNPACKFINLSSAAVYGNPKELPIKESTELSPLSPYGFHKMYSETICKEFHDLFGIQSLSVRIFSAYGEGLKKQLFWDLHKKLESSNGQIELFGTGKETRDFIYIKDLVSALDCIVQRAAFSGNSINVASGIESTIADAVGYFVSASGKNVNVHFSGLAKMGDPANWRADISLLKSFGFKNTYSLKEGISNYCQWVQEKRSL